MTDAQHVSYATDVHVVKCDILDRNMKKKVRLGGFFLSSPMMVDHHN